MRVRVLALFAGIVVLASCVLAKKKEKQVLPDAVLRAQTVFVVIQPDAKEPLTEPNANLKAQKAVEEALMKWGKFRLALDTTTADIVISVEKGAGKPMSPTISGGPVDSRPVDVEGDASQIRIMGQKGHPDTTSISTNDPNPNARAQTGTQAGGSEDVLRLFIGGAVEYPSCAGMDVFAEGCIEGSGSGSGSGVEKGIRGVGEGRGGTGKTKAATTAGEKLALRSTTKM